VLEDDAHAGSVMTDYLRSQGHAAELLPNGTDALWFVTKNQPDVVVMDIFMPGSDGLQAVRDIRARGPEIVIIAISGRFQHGEHFLRCARHLGATHVLPKPIDVAQLAVLVAGRPPVI
jgi:CheY-like chemotaxis protein